MDNVTPRIPRSLEEARWLDEEANMPRTPDAPISEPRLNNWQGSMLVWLTHFWLTRNGRMPEVEALLTAMTPAMPDTATWKALPLAKRVALEAVTECGYDDPTWLACFERIP